MSIEICGCSGRLCFYQWDTGRKLQDREMSLGSKSQAHFTDTATGEVLAKDFYNDEGVMRCDVPDVLLQTDSPIEVHIYTTNEYGEYTEKYTQFQVQSRQKPPGYTYMDATEAVKEHNAEVLALTGTEQPTAVEAVVELNATLASHLNAKGIEVEPSETSEVLVTMVDSIPNPQDVYSEGYDVGVRDTNTATLAVTGTDNESAVDAITEINATLATNLAAKGVTAEATETTATLAGMVSDIADPQEAYQEGYDEGFDKGSKDGWIYEWARQCTYTGTLQSAEITEIGDLVFEKALTIDQNLFSGKQFITKVGNITGKTDRYGSGGMFYNCTNLLSAGNITIECTSGIGSHSKISGMFRGCSNLKKVGLVTTIDIASLDYLFSDCASLVEFGGIESSVWTNGNSMFAFCNKLREITHPIDFTSCGATSEMFRGCGALEEVRFVPNTINVGFSSYGSPAMSTKLSDASIQSLVDGLKDRTGQTALTIAFHADVKARMTEAQIATVTGKNWTIA